MQLMTALCPVIVLAPCYQCAPEPNEDDSRMNLYANSRPPTILRNKIHGKSENDPHRHKIKRMNDKL